MANHNVGALRREVGERNKARVLEYFRANPFKTQRDCAKELGLNVCVISRHVMTLRAEMEAAKQEA